MTTILLGPQRFTVTARAALRSLGVEGAVATVNAGWEEREGEDGGVGQELGVEDDLREAGAVAEVDEDELAVVAAQR